MAHAASPAPLAPRAPFTPLAANFSRRISPLPHLMRGVWIQALRRRELYVVAILIGIYALAALVLRIVGIDSPQVARFVSGLGFELASALTSLLVIVIGARGVAEELEQRTIYPILAKPVARWQFLAGKAIPTLGLGAAALLVFSLTTLAIAPHLPYQSALGLLQALALKTLALSILTALVIALSLELPVGVAMLIAATFNFGGALIANFLTTLAPGSLWMRAVTGLIPDFTVLSQFERYVNGGAPLTLTVMLTLICYATIWTALLSALGIARFEKMRL